MLSSASLALDLGRVRACVLDEADRLLDRRGSFVQLGEMQRIFEGIIGKEGEEQSQSRHQRKRPFPLQWLLFTATETAECVEFVGERGGGSPPSIFRVDSVQETGEFVIPQGISLEYALVPSRVRIAYLCFLLDRLWLDSKKGNIKSRGLASAFCTTFTSSSSGMIIFVNKCRTGELLRLMLRRLEIVDAAALHSMMPQVQRTAALQAFRNGQRRVLIATDVGSRGLDLPSVDLVLNFDVPRDARDFVHRVGRTGRLRAGGACNNNQQQQQQCTGRAFTLMTEMDCQLIETLETKLGKRLVELQVPPSLIHSPALHWASAACSEDSPHGGIKGAVPMDLDEFEKECILPELTRIEDARLEATHWLQQHCTALLQRETRKKKKFAQPPGLDQ